MADKDLAQGQALLLSDKTRYVEIASGVYAQLVATAEWSVIPAEEALTLTHTAVNVNGDTAILAANGNRRYLLIVNDSDTVIYLRLQTGAAVINQGVRLNASGGSYEMTSTAGIYRGAVRANHGGGAVNKVLLITEGV